MTADRDRENPFGGWVPSLPDDDDGSRAARLLKAREVLADVLAGRSTLRVAAGVLGVQLDDAGRTLDARRLAVYRAYVGQAVRVASPLAFRVCELHGMDLDAIAMELRPGMPWDQWLCGVRPGDAWLRSLAGLVNAADAPEKQRREWAMWEWLHAGRSVWGSDLYLKFGIRVIDAGLEMAAFPGGHRIRTQGREGAITLRMELPHTVMAALPGMPLDRLMDHPLTNGAGCVVTAVDESSPRWGTKVRFALDPVPWRMPWAR